MMNFADMVVLGWRPFLDPLNFHSYWWAFLVPLSFLISVTYRAVRMRDLTGYWRAVGVMTAQIIIAMIALGAAAFIFVEFLVPMLAPVRS
jgi:hypothetical protein